MVDESDFEDDMKKFLRLPPYESGTGADWEFAKELEKKYGRPISGSVWKFLRAYEDGRYLKDDENG